MNWFRFASACALLLVAGCGNMGGPDFALESNAPRAKLIAGFADLKSGIASWPLAWPDSIKPRLDRPNPDELLFTIPSSENETGSTFHLQFADGDTPGSTSISVNVEIAEVGALSESTEENLFRETAKVLIDDIAQQRSTELTGNLFTGMFYAIALESNPAAKKAIEAAEAADNAAPEVDEESVTDE